jgi:hypothetical protein
VERPKKICFALLVHDKKELVKQLIENIYFYCPNSSIVLFNGGEDPALCEHLNVPVCPTSRKLEYGYTTIYFLEAMEWVEENGIDYDYFINIDSDVLFIHKGFEEFIASQMSDTDYLGVGLRPDDSWVPGMEFKKDIERWHGFFCVYPFYGVFNVGQVFSKKLVKELVSYPLKESLKKALIETPAFGTDEIVYVNLAKELGFKVKSYPKELEHVIRYRPHFSIDEILKMLHTETYNWLCHPIYRNEAEPIRQLILAIQNKESNQNYRKEEYPWYHLESSRYSPSIPTYTTFHCHELVCREDTFLYHYYFYDINWNRTVKIASEVGGNPLFYESTSGNFEVICPLKSGGIGYWWRDNKSKTLKWSEQVIITHENVEPVVLTQLNDNNLLFIGKKGDMFFGWTRNNRNYWLWNGPYYL